MAERRLADVLSRGECERGSPLLAHYHLLGACSPDLLDRFQEMYKQLVLTEQALPMRDKELLLTALGVTVREQQVRHHLTKGLALGLTHDDLADAIALSATVSSFSAFGFVRDNWGTVLPEGFTTARYVAAFEQARGGIDPAVAETIAIACHAVRRTHAGMRLHLERAFPAGATVAGVAEALSFLVMVTSIPTLTDAATVWAEAARGGLCPAPYAAP